MRRFDSGQFVDDGLARLLAQFKSDLIVGSSVRVRDSIHMFGEGVLTRGLAPIVASTFAHTYDFTAASGGVVTDGVGSDNLTSGGTFAAGRINEFGNRGAAGGGMQASVVMLVAASSPSQNGVVLAWKSAIAFTSDVNIALNLQSDNTMQVNNTPVPGWVAGAYNVLFLNFFGSDVNAALNTSASTRIYSGAPYRDTTADGYFHRAMPGFSTPAFTGAIDFAGVFVDSGGLLTNVSWSTDRASIASRVSQRQSVTAP